jgi:hypothetical protein
VTDGEMIDEATRLVLQAVGLVRRFTELAARGHRFTVTERAQLTATAALLADLRATIANELAISSVLTDADRVRSVFPPPEGSA